MDFDKFTDIILMKFKDGQVHHIYAVISGSIPLLKREQDQQVLLVEYMTEKQLVRQDEFDGSDSQYRITITGLNIINEYGGWLKYLESQQVQSKESERIQQMKEKKKERISIFHTIIAATEVLLVALSIYLAHKTSTHQGEIELLVRQNDSISVVTAAQNHLMEKIDRQLQTLTLQIDSLANAR